MRRRQKPGEQTQTRSRHIKTTRLSRQAPAVASKFLEPGCVLLVRAPYAENSADHKLRPAVVLERIDDRSAWVALITTAPNRNRRIQRHCFPVTVEPGFGSFVVDDFLLIDRKLDVVRFIKFLDDQEWNSLQQQAWLRHYRAQHQRMEGNVVIEDLSQPLVVASPNS